MIYNRICQHIKWYCFDPFLAKFDCFAANIICAS